MEIKVLNKGFVILVDIMGNDSSIVQAARTSYGTGVKSYEEDKKLIRYLLRNKHTSPFEMVELKFHIKLPIFVARQWIRHRTANVNELSGRYAEMKNEFYIPNEENIREQSTTNKQGRSDNKLNQKSAVEFTDSIIATQKKSFIEYKNYIETGVARELARINLPLSIYTEWYWKIDLHNLFHFLKLRLDNHAQYEIRCYAEAIATILKEKVPIAYQAFEDYILNTIYFSDKEQIVLANLLKNINLYDINFENIELDKREINELKVKLNTLKEKQIKN